eukprot:TRINITY_DN6898_c0_g1_i1.p2 TRINITY_DN6898_c0_g1~~TRINITY_DN6898_c0_g1_i1.p2  ORF type:complete len:130 (-),score=18.62 TRINITY_DN6898_c0_g1_i1:103-492(-)
MTKGSLPARPPTPAADPPVAANVSFKSAKWEASKQARSKRRRKTLKQILADERLMNLPPSVPTLSSIAAPPNLSCSRKYCDVTGFETTYTDPKTKLRFYNPKIYKVMQFFTMDRVQEYLRLRQAHVVLR